MQRAPSRWFRALLAIVSVSAGVGTYLVLTSNNRAVLPMLYVFMPGVATGMVIHSRRISLLTSALTNTVFSYALLMVLRRIWCALRGSAPAAAETPPPVP